MRIRVCAYMCICVYVHIICIFICVQYIHRAYVYRCRNSVTMSRNAARVQLVYLLTDTKSDPSCCVMNNNIATAAAAKQDE